MREIKFRAWDKKDEVIGLVTVLKYVDDKVNGVHMFHENGIGGYKMMTIGQVELMQYTGLKDENGVDIYEGDILSVDWGDMKSEEYIESNGYDKAFVVEFRNYAYDPFSRFLPIADNIEVIGNIYENPELLNERGMDE